MFRDRGADRTTGVWLVAVGAAAGFATGLLMARRRAGWPGVMDRGLAGLETRIQEAIDADPILYRRDLNAGALADGIVELTGTVRDEAEAEHAIALARRVPGVRTVLNRLDLQILEDHLADTRRRFAEGDPSLVETHWYGIRVGTGRRRQAEETDPDRPSDRLTTVSRELGANRAVEQTSERLDKLPNGVEGHTTLPAGPTDRGTAEHTSHRRLGNVPEEPVQDLHPEARIHENIKKGTEVTLEEAGVEEERSERYLEDRP